jgi:hypothetical protein
VTISHDGAHAIIMEKWENKRHNSDTAVMCSFLVTLRCGEPVDGIMKNYGCGGKGLRSHHDGIPRPQGREGPAARQRNPESADPFADTRAGVSLRPFACRVN